MEPLRKIIELNRDSVVDLPVELTLEEIRMLDHNLGMIGMALARQYAKEAEFQQAIRVLAEENGRLYEEIEGKKKKKTGFSA